MYISADFEGSSGITNRGQCFQGNPGFEAARRLWIGDINTEASELIPEVETAVVKTGLSQFTAHCLPLQTARGLITAAAKRACQRAAELKPVPLPKSLRMEIDFSLTEIAKLCSFIPGVEPAGARTVAFSSQDYRQLQHVRIVCTNLALAVIRDHF